MSSEQTEFFKTILRQLELHAMTRRKIFLSNAMDALQKYIDCDGNLIKVEHIDDDGIEVAVRQYNGV